MGNRVDTAMTDDEALLFLRRQKKVHIATLNRDGSAHMTTLFYRMLDDAVAFWTYRRSQKAVNLRRDNRITALVEEGEAYDELRGVSVVGTAMLVEDTAEVRSLAIKMFSSEGAISDSRMARIEAQSPKRAIVAVKPQRYVSWDHAKLRAPG